MKLIDQEFMDMFDSMLGPDGDALLLGRYLVEPDDLVEVYTDKRVSNAAWFNDVPAPQKTHKAFLIKSSIQPIEKDNIDKFLSDFLQSVVDHSEGIVPKVSIQQLSERAKALLESEDE